MRQIIAGNIYHVLNRGVDKRKIFMDDFDYLRFIHDLFEFNDKKPANNTTYFFKKEQSNDVRRRYIEKRNPRELLVEVLAFCLMPNHYHLLLKPKTDDAIFKFLKKLNGGYAKYFNEKYERSGVLFQGRYKSVVVEREAHFIHIPYYIHLNPLDLVAPEWREGKINNYSKVIKFLESYRWSSYLDYIGHKNFPSLTQREFILKIFKGEENYRKQTMQWLKDLSLENFKDIVLE